MDLIPTKMSAKRRFLTAMMGGKPDRAPVGNVVSVACVELMEMANTWFPDAHLQAECMADLAAAGHTILGYDTVMPVFSVVQEAAALGCQIDWGSPDMMPGVRTHPFAQSVDFHIPENWIEASSIVVVLEALRLLRSRLGHKVVIVGKVMGPWSLSYHMMGIEEFLICTLEDPDRARRLLTALKSVTIEFAKAQMQVGADIICLADHATGGMVSPLAYRDFLLPLHQEIISEMSCPTVLHCCGNTTDRLVYFTQAGFDCYHFESQVRLADAVSSAAGKMTLIGNINNPQILLSGTPAQVKEACRSVLNSGVQILAPECAIALTTPVKNLRILVEVAENESP
jgi:MtaA/CmuA family methyltransferase